MLQRASSISLTELGDDLEAAAGNLEQSKAKYLPQIVEGSTISSEHEAFEKKVNGFFETGKIQPKDKL